MTQAPSRGPLLQVKPAPNIYTLLLIVAIVALIFTISVVLYNLLAGLPNGYGLSFGQVLKGALPPE
jgi:hypothetical protein